jgi:high-affinity iron transporter
MGAAFLITLREGFEAALIVAIVLTYLRHVDRTDRAPAVLAGVAGASAACLAIGVVLFLTVDGLDGDPRRITFAAIGVAAVAVLTWMVFWMQRQARNISGELHRQIDDALADGSGWALASLAFIAVFREGMETVLFLLAVFTGSEPARLGLGAALGLVAALAIGCAIYLVGQRIHLRLFFQLSSVLVLLVAAGLASRSLAWIQEAGLIPTYWWPVWNVVDNPVVGHGTFAQFLNGLFGWNPRPSAEELVVWAAYVAITTALFFGLVRIPLRRSSVDRWKAPVAR